MCICVFVYANVYVVKGFREEQTAGNVVEVCIYVYLGKHAHVPSSTYVQLHFQERVYIKCGNVTSLSATYNRHVTC